MRKMTAAVALSVATVLFAVPVRAEGIKEGQWDMTMQMEGMGKQMAQAQAAMDKMSAEEKAMMQQMMGGTSIGATAGGMNISRSQCITAGNPVPQRDEDKNCKSTHTIAGNKVTFEVICPDGTSTGEITYNNESMSGVIKSNAKGADVTMNISGKYAGPCQDPKHDVSAHVQRAAAKNAVKDAARSLLSF